MDQLKGELTFLTNNGSQEKLLKFCSDKRGEITCGTDVLADIRVVDDRVSELHFKIYLNEAGKVRIQNFSASNPISVNDEVTEGKRDLKSGSIIDIAGRKMRWETKADVKRRTALLTKQERKEIKHKFVKTNKRITIHNFAIESIAERLGSAEETSASSSDEKSPQIREETNEESPMNGANSSTVAPALDKENESTPSKAAKLNTSGVLITSYTPERVTRSATKTPFSSPMRSPLVKSAAKSILNESLNVQNAKTPNSSKLLNSSMHLVDLTTPFGKRDTTSTPKTVPRQTPKTAARTPALRNQILLKSALKNSSIKKAAPSASNVNTPKGKVLFESPAKDTSSVIEVSLSDSSKLSFIEVSSGSYDSAQNDTPKSENSEKAAEENGSSSVEKQVSKDDDVKSLLETISSVLDEETKNAAEPISNSETTIEKDFNEIAEQHTMSGEINNSLFEKDLSTVPNEVIENFDKLVEDENNTDDVEKKGEALMEFIESTRKTLTTAEPNETVQVFSARFSNITPNDSLSEGAQNVSQKYDASTPGISLLLATTTDKTESARKSDIFDARLTCSPVSRLSLTKDSTEVVENYQLNTNNSKSLRSTRKRFGTAMASLHNLSQSCDTTLNETIDTSTDNKEQIDAANVSQTDATNFLSLDEQLNSSNKENEYTSVGNNSIHFVQYKEKDENNHQISTTVFEISNEENDVDNDGVESESDSESSSEEEEGPEEAEEYLEEEYLDASNPDQQATEVPQQAAFSKFRISQEDLQEEGINPLDVSRGDEQMEQPEAENEANSSDLDKVFDIIPETQQLDNEEVENREENSLVHEEIPETQQFLEDDLPNEQLPEQTENDESGSKLAEEMLEASVPEERLEEQTETDNDKSEIFEELQDDSTTAEHIEIPATQAFEDSTIVDEAKYNLENISENLEENNSVVELDDSTILSSQEQINKSDSLSIQELSDTTASECYSQESNVKQEEISQNIKDDEIENGEEMTVMEIDAREAINKSVMEDAPLEPTETLESISTNVSETINELIHVPTETLGTIAALSSSESNEAAAEKMPSNDINQEDNDSAIESKIDNSEQSDGKNFNESSSPMSPRDNRASNMFSDTEFSAVISESLIDRIDDADEPEMDENVSNGNEQEELQEKLKSDVQKELENVDFERKFERKGKSIIPPDTLKSIESRKTMVPETLNSSFEKFMDEAKDQNEQTEENVEQENAEELAEEQPTNIESESENADSKYDEIEQELARMNEEPAVGNKRRPASLMPSDEVSGDKLPASSRMTIIPPKDSLRKSFLQDLEEEKVALAEKQSLEVIEEKPKVVVDVENEVNETEAEKVIEEEPQQAVEEETQQPAIEDAQPVVEEPCIQKTAYITTDNEEKDQVAVPETPSRRRVARINYSELATGSPARSRKRSTSTESNGKKDIEPKSAKQCVKMEAIVEDDVTLKITVTASESVNEEPAREFEEIASEQPQVEDTSELVTEKAPENNVEMTEENDKPQEAEAGLEQIEETEPEQQQVEDISEEVTEKNMEVIEENDKPQETVQQYLEQADENVVEEVNGESDKIQDNEIPEKEEAAEIPAEISQPSEDSEKADENVESQVSLAKEKVPAEMPENEKLPEEEKEEPENVVHEAESKKEGEPVEEIKQPEKEPSPQKSSVETANEKEKAVAEVPVHKEIAAVNLIEDAPETPRKRAKKLDYLQLASGSRRKRAASRDEKNTEVAKTIDVQQLAVETITEEITKEADETPSNEPAEVTTKSPGRPRKIVEQLKTAVEEVQTPSKRSKRTPAKSDVEPPKRGRKRDEKSVEKNAAPEKVTETITLSSDDNNTQEEEAPKAVAAPAKKGRGRLPKVVEEEAKTESEEVAPVKQARGRKNKVEEPKVPEEKEKVEPPKKRGRAAKVVEETKAETPVVAAKSTRKRVHETPVKEVEKVEEKAESPVAKKRGKAAKSEPEKASTSKKEEQQEEKPTKRRGAAAKTVETVVEKTEEAAPPRRGRKKAEPQKEESKEPETPKTSRKHKLEEVPEEPVEVAPKRGRKGKVEVVPEPVVEEAPKAKGRGRKAKAEPATPQVEETPEAKNEPVTKGQRGRRKQVEETPKTAEVPSQSTEEEKPVAKRGRGRQAKVAVEEKTEEKTEEVPQAEKQTTPKRGRKANTPAAVEEKSEPATKKPRGRQAKQQPETVAEKSPSVTKTPPGKLRNASKHVTIVTPSTMAGIPKESKTEASETAAPAKRATKRKAQPTVEEPVVTAKRSTRAKK